MRPLQMGIAAESSRNKSARKKVVTLPKKIKTNKTKKPKQVKDLAFLCANKQTKPN